MLLRAGGAAVPDEVWDRYLRPARWSEWSPQIRTVSTHHVVLVPGMTGTVHGPLGVSVDFVVTDVDATSEVRSWSWWAWRGPVPLRLHHTVIPTATGTETTLRIDGFLPVVLGYAPIAQIALGRLVRP